MKLQQMIEKIQDKWYKEYRSLDFLPAWNFFQVLKTSDPRYLLKLKDYEKLPKYYPKSWATLYNEFLQKNDSQGWMSQLLITEHIERLRNDLFIITRMCIYLLNHDRCKKSEEYEKYLKDLGYKITEDYEESIVNIIKSTKGIEKKIELKKEELKRPESENISIDDTIAAINLQLPSMMDLKRISVNEFIGIKNALENKNKPKGKNGR